MDISQLHTALSNSQNFSNKNRKKIITMNLTTAASSAESCVTVFQKVLLSGNKTAKYYLLELQMTAFITWTANFGVFDSGAASLDAGLNDTDGGNAKYRPLITQLLSALEQDLLATSTDTEEALKTLESGVNKEGDDSFGSYPSNCKHHRQPS
ncbi:hypothetical protein G7Y89_g7163 [Cudoniella acicularis]|uniref:Uncharacterized protein n=1 Tax=Cudoniella acicularis TaxID=354080 RepID=A0A8H4W433_9HELO|nr:hypothetical protein G7Y89_g7163 [Cudoniella acicularis]